MGFCCCLILDGCALHFLFILLMMVIQFEFGWCGTSVEQELFLDFIYFYQGIQF